MTLSLPTPSVLDLQLESLLRAALAVHRGSPIAAPQDVHKLVTTGAWFGGSPSSDAAATLEYQRSFVPRPPYLTPAFSRLVTATAAGDLKAWRRADRILERVEDDDTRAGHIQQVAADLRDRLALYVWPLDERARNLLRPRLLEPQSSRRLLDVVTSVALRETVTYANARHLPFGASGVEEKDVESACRMHIFRSLSSAMTVPYAWTSDVISLVSDALRRFRARRFADEVTAPIEKPIDPDVQADLDKIAEVFGLADDQRIRAGDVEIDDIEDETAAVEIKEIEAGSLVVVPSLDHLPGHTKGSASGDKHSPAAEFSHLATKALPLASCEWLPDARRDLLAAFPWAQDIIDTILRDLVGRTHVRIRPTVLVGPPGCGKTALARAIGRALLGDEPTVYSCSGALDSSFAGTSRQWGTGRASVPLQAIRRSKVANPIIILDEIEKGGGDRRNGNLGEALIPFLERETSQAHHDLYLECPVDLSEVSYLATANSLEGVSAPLLSRLRILKVGMPAREHVGLIARRRLEAVRQDLGMTPHWCPDLTPEEVEAVERAWLSTHADMRSLRLITRAVEVVVSTREALTAWH